MPDLVREATQVVIIGAGPAGLTLANLLRRDGVESVVLEVRSREHVEQRQRAGLLDHTGTLIFEEYGLVDEVLAGSPSGGQLEIRLDGEPHLLDTPAMADGRAGRMVPQQLLVRRLLATFTGAGGEVRFDADEVTPHDVTTDAPRVTYRGGDGVGHEITCAYVAGCDGFHGVSRRSIPEGERTEFSYDHGLGWLTILADAPPPRHPLMAISRHGFAAHFARGPQASRFYLQYPPGGGDPRKWPDEQVWSQLRLRFGDDSLAAGPITDREVVEMRSHVTEPMTYGRLHLAGDAAHIITPMGAKGLNLALTDAYALAKALVPALRTGDESALARYSDVCLRRTWDYQDYSRWFSEMVHDAGDHSLAGPFRRKLALARFHRLITSPTAGAAFADIFAGTPLTP